MIVTNGPTVNFEVARGAARDTAEDFTTDTLRAALAGGERHEEQAKNHGGEEGNEEHAVDSVHVAITVVWAA